MAVQGAQAISFNGVDFTKYVVQTRHPAYGPSFVAHRFPMRRGAKQEQTGDLPFRAEHALEFAGREWANNARAVIGAMIQKPRGTYVDPLYGKIRAVLKGPISGTWDPVQKGTHYAVTLIFEEDTLTNALDFSRTPTAVGDEVTASSTHADAQMALFVQSIFDHFTVGSRSLQLRAQSLAVQATTMAFTTQARSYSASAIEQFQAGQITPDLATRLSRLPTAMDAAVIAMRPIETLNAYGSGMVDAAELTLRYARDLDRAIRANLPPPIQWTVAQPMDLFRLVGWLYPTRNLDEKIALFQSILTTNRLSRPDALYAGQVIAVPAP